MTALAGVGMLCIGTAVLPWRYNAPWAVLVWPRMCLLALGGACLVGAAVWGMR